MLKTLLTTISYSLPNCFLLLLGFILPSPKKLSQDPVPSPPTHCSYHSQKHIPKKAAFAFSIQTPSLVSSPLQGPADTQGPSQSDRNLSSLSCPSIPLQHPHLQPHKPDKSTTCASGCTPVTTWTTWGSFPPSLHSTSKTQLYSRVFCSTSLEPTQM